MRIVGVSAKNILSFDELKIGFGNFNVIVGPNNSGKTNLFRLFRLIQTMMNGQAFPDAQGLLNNNNVVGFRVDMQLKLDEEELSYLGTFMELYLLAEARTTRSNGINIGQPVSDEQFNRFSTLFTGPFKDNFVAWFVDAVSNGTLIFEYQGFPGQPPSLRYSIRTGDATEAAIRLNDWNLAPTTSGGRQTIIQTFASFVVNRPEGVHRLDRALQNPAPHVEDIQSFLRFAFRENQGFQGIGMFYNEILNSQDADLLVKISRLMASAKVSFPVNANVSIGQFLFTLFNDSFILAEEFRIRPSQSLEPTSTEPATSFESDKLAVVLFRLLTSRESYQRTKYEEIKAAFRATFGGKFDFDVSSDDRDVGGRRATITSVTVTNLNTRKSIPIEYTGSGVAEVLYILTLVIGMGRKIVFLDEPAAHVHPTTQRKLLEQIRSLNLANQVFIITHSPFLVSSKQPTEVARFYLANDATRYCRLVEDESSVYRVVKMIERSPRLLFALFSDKAVVFEGEYEQAALLAWFPRCDPPLVLEDHNVEFVTAGSHSSFQSYYNLLESWHIPAFIIGDNLATSITAGIQKKFLVREDDLSELLEEECNQAFTEANRLFPARQGGKNPQIARYVAEEAEPPPEIREMCESVRGFVQS